MRAAACETDQKNTVELHLYLGNKLGLEEWHYTQQRPFFAEIVPF